MSVSRISPENKENSSSAAAERKRGCTHAGVLAVASSATETLRFALRGRIDGCDCTIWLNALGRAVHSQIAIGT